MVESILELYNDMIPAIAKVVFAKEDQKKERVDELLEYFNKTGSYLETILSQNNGGKGYFVGDSMTVADIAVFAVLGMCDETLSGCGAAIDFSSKPLLKGLKDRVASNPKIKAYYAK